MTLPPESHHLTDPLLLPFLAPSFSASTYLNTALPPPPSSKPHPQPTLNSLASQTQSHISTLSAQTTRLSATLTSLTDDILRCSSRLTYEIELLRAEANTLIETLSERGDLNPAIRTFLPDGLPPTKTTPHTKKNNNDDPNALTPPASSTPTSTPKEQEKEKETPIQNLRTLLT
ncbi:MAG: hypothetical protein Q9223_001497, partial [Gallowayella weberi]